MYASLATPIAFVECCGVSDANTPLSLPPSKKDKIIETLNINTVKYAVNILHAENNYYICLILCGE